MLIALDMRSSGTDEPVSKLCWLQWSWYSGYFLFENISFLIIPNWPAENTWYFIICDFQLVGWKFLFFYDIWWFSISEAQVFEIFDHIQLAMWEYLIIFYHIQFARWKYFVIFDHIQLVRWKFQSLVSLLAACSSLMGLIFPTGGDENVII